MKITAIIPIRYGSTRFPGKALALIKGKPMIWHVYQQVSLLAQFDRVIIATDDRRIYRCVSKFGGEVVMTSAQHSSGTDRIAEVARKLPCDLVVNVQGDEPLIAPEMIAAAIQPFFRDENLLMGTLKKRITEQVEVNDHNVVKVVTDQDDFALYFSRLPIPFLRKPATDYYKHIGLYVYRRDFLLKYTQLPPTPLEKSESLEQLRALENGYRIKVVETEFNSIGVDTPADIVRVEQLLARR